MEDTKMQSVNTLKQCVVFLDIKNGRFVYVYPTLRKIQAMHSDDAEDWQDWE